jgi:hypothetical protein
MMGGLKIKEMNQIVNLELWRRFSRARRDLLCSKSENSQLLTQLGLSEPEILQRTQHRDQGNEVLQSSPYSDNVALLFHGTMASSGVEVILLEGLDERLGMGDYLGKESTSQTPHSKPCKMTSMEHSSSSLSTWETASKFEKLRAGAWKG